MREERENAEKREIEVKRGNAEKRKEISLREWREEQLVRQSESRVRKLIFLMHFFDLSLDFNGIL